MVRRALPLLALALLLACADPVARAGDDDGGDLVGVRVESVRLDVETRSPVLLLEEQEGDRTLPIWIGVSEARSIVGWLEGEAAPRPNTHDLATRLVGRLDGRLERVVVTKLEGGIFFARMVITRGDTSREVDARPSDAIAIALRMDAPLFVHASVFAAAAADPDARGHDIGSAAPERDRQLPSLSL